MSYRPEGWKNPHSTPTTSNELVNLQTFMWKLHGAAHRSLLADTYEAGADAMLEVLKAKGTYVEAHKQICHTADHPGTLIFLKDEE